jgi:hypothetical protein
MKLKSTLEPEAERSAWAVKNQQFERKSKSRVRYLAENQPSPFSHPQDSDNFNYFDLVDFGWFCASLSYTLHQNAAVAARSVANWPLTHRIR